MGIIYLLPQGDLAAALGGKDNALFRFADSASPVLSRDGVLTPGQEHTVSYVVFDTDTGIGSVKRETVTPGAFDLSLVPNGYVGRAIKRAAAQNRPANVMILGHSHVAGQGSGTGTDGLVGAARLGFAGQLARKLNPVGMSADRASVFGEGNATYSITATDYDSRLKLGSGWSVDGEPQSFGGRFIVQPEGNTGTLDIVPGFKFSKIRFWYPVANGISSGVSVRIDDVEKVVVNQNQPNSLTYTDVEAEGSKFSLKNIGTGQGYFIGVEFYRSAQLARVVPVGHCSARMVEYTASYAPWMPSQQISRMESDLGILYLMTNDIMQGTAVADWKAGAKGILQTFQATGEAIVVIDPPAADFDATAYGQYVTAANELVSEIGCGLLDLKSLFGSYPNSVSQGWQYDKLHPSFSGHSKIADAIVALGN